MIRVLPLLTILVCTLAFSAATPADSVAKDVEIIAADDWARPRSGESLVQMPALKRTLRDYLAERQQNGTRIVIRHPRGEEGVLWAEELRGWLVALGIPSADIEVSPESTRIDAIELAVVGAGN
jgi:hypothetical protein